MTTIPPRRRRLRWWHYPLIALGALLVLCILIVALALSSTNRPAPAQAAPKATVAPTVTPTPKRVSTLLSYQSVCDAYNAKTSAQWDAYAETIRGQRIGWAGTVRDVTADGEISLRIGTNGTLRFKVPASEATSYSVDQRIALQADIADVTQCCLIGDCLCFDLTDVAIQ